MFGAFRGWNVLGTYGMEYGTWNGMRDMGVIYEHGRWNTWFVVGYEVKYAFIQFIYKETIPEASDLGCWSNLNRSCISLTYSAPPCLRSSAATASCPLALA